MRPGFALPIVMFVISLGGALAIGGAFVTRQAAAGARAANRALELETAASGTLARLVAGWDWVVQDSQTIGAVVSSTTSLGRVRVASWITRTSARHFWLVTEASAGGKPLLRRRLGVLIRVDSGIPRVVSGRGWSELP